MRRVTDILQIGKENALSAEYLMQAFGIDRRSLYKEVAKERKEGSLILTDGNGGYYIPDETTAAGQTEIEAFKHRMKAMGRSIAAAAKGVQKSVQ